MVETLRCLVSVFVIPVVMIFTSSALADPPGQKNVNCNSDGAAAVQQAIDNADEGTVIRVNGTCTGVSFVISTDGLTLHGQGNASITGDGAAPAVTITGNRVTVENWAFIDGNGSDGVVVGASASARVQDITTLMGNDGIVVKEAAFVEIDGVLDIDADDDGIFVTQNGVALIMNTNSSENDGDGVVVGGGGVITLNGGNTINKNYRYGIFASGGQIQINGANTIQGHPLYDVRCTGFTRILVTKTLSSTSGNKLEEPGLCFVTGPVSLF